MAVYVVISTKAQTGKAASAREAALATATYLNESNKYAGTYEILTNVDGSLGRMHWCIRCESMDAFERDAQQRRVDADWRELFKSVADVVDLDNTETHLYRIEEASS